MKALLVAVALVLGASAVATTGPADAAVSKYGSIALNPKTGAFGYSHGYVGPNLARRIAQTYCKRYNGNRPGCRTLTVFYNKCAALVQNKVRGNYGWGVARSRRHAIRIAYNFCNKYGGGCSYKVVFCSH